MRAEPARLVIAAPGYPQDDMPDRERVMATLASYLLWPAAQRDLSRLRISATNTKSLQELHWR
jgi:hypothetical protein